MTDIPLIKKIASTKKPIIISTGMANLNEIRKTFSIAKKYGARDITCFTVLVVIQQKMKNLI